MGPSSACSLRHYRSSHGLLSIALSLAISTGLAYSSSWPVLSLLGFGGRLPYPAGVFGRISAWWTSVKSSVSLSTSVFPGPMATRSVEPSWRVQPSEGPCVNSSAKTGHRPTSDRDSLVDVRDLVLFAFAHPSCKRCAP